MNGEWVRNEAATSVTGLPIDQLEHESRDAVVSHTPLPDGTATVSVSVHVLGIGSREYARDLLARLAPEAIEK